MRKRKKAMQKLKWSWDPIEQGGAQPKPQFFIRQFLKFLPVPFLPHDNLAFP